MAVRLAAAKPRSDKPKPAGPRSDKPAAAKPRIDSPTAAKPRRDRRIIQPDADPDRPRHLRPRCFARLIAAAALHR
jgi:hypothetical protein